MSMSKAFYMKSEDITDERVDTQRGMICRGIEKLIGKGKLKAAQKLGRKWILNAMDEECRLRIVTAGRVEVGRVAVSVYANDPFAVLGPDGKERATTKLIIDGVPLQEGEKSIKKRLEELGAIFCAKDPIKLENHYDTESKRFSELLTGRRYAYIVLPIKELPKAIRVGPYIARLYYKEMVKELPACRNCNEKGHWANQCPQPKRCYDCKQTGHKKGDEACPVVQTIFGTLNINQVNQEKGKDSDNLEDHHNTDDSEDEDGTGSESESETESLHDDQKKDKEEKEVEEGEIENDTVESVGEESNKMLNEKHTEDSENNVDINKNRKHDETESDEHNTKETEKGKKGDFRGRTQSSMNEFVKRMRSGSNKRDRSPQSNADQLTEGQSKKHKKTKAEKKKEKARLSNGKKAAKK